MLENKDYCDYDTCVALREVGYKGISRYFYATKESPLRRYSCDQILTTRIADAVGHTLAIPLYSAQKWLREEKGIHIAPRIYLYHDINLDEQTSWECTIYVEWSAIYTIGKSLTYEDALLLGIKEAVKILKGKDGIS